MTGTEDRTGRSFTVVLGDAQDPPAALTPQQQDVLFVERTDPVPGRYTVPVFVVLDEVLDQDRLATAVAAVASRRALLRSTVEQVDGESVLRTYAVADVRVAEVAAPPATGEDCAKEVAARGVPLTATPLWRVEQHPLADGRALLAVLCHHIVVDGWAVELLLADLAEAYRDGAPTRGDDLTPAELAEGDRGADDLALARAHWARAAQYPPPPWRPPAARSATPSGAGDTVRRVLPAEFAGQLTALSARCGATPYVVALSAFGEVARRFSGQSEVLVGSPFHNRLDKARQNTVGMLATTLPLRLPAARGRALTEVTDAVADALYAAAEHAAIPSGELRRLWAGEASAAGDPLCQLVFGMHTGAAAPDFGVGARRLWADTGTAKFAMTWNLLEGADLVLEAEFDTALYPRPMVDAMVDAWLRTIRELHADTLVPLDRVVLADDVVTGAARRASATGGIATGIFSRAHTAPDAIALSDVDEQWTYGALADLAGRWVSGLLAAGARRGDRVVVVARRRADTVAAMLGVLAAGMVSVPVEPDAPAGRARFQVADSGAGFMIGTADWDLDAPGIVPVEPGTQIAAPADHPDDPAYVIYTSGSTGAPKGVVVPHAAVRGLADVGAATFGFGPDDVWTAFHSFAFDFSVWELWVALLTGGGVVLVDKQLAREPGALHRVLSEKSVTVLNQTPSAFRNLERADATARDPLALRHVIFGGEAVDLAAVDRWRARHPEHRLWNMFGITETTVHVTLKELTGAAASASPIGVPLDRADIRLADEHGGAVAPYQVGEILVGGHGVANGYWGSPALTADRFRPRAGGDRRYHSGDHAYRDTSGELHYVGRIDGQVKVRGYRIELGEIKAALLGVGGVRDAIVLLDTAGATPRLLGFVRADADLDVRHVREGLARTLPAHMIPHVLTPVAEIPLTPNGKIDEAALLATAAPAPVARREAAEVAATPGETALLAVLRDVLGEPGMVATDDFFAMGGDSIIALQVVDRAAAHGLRLRVRDVFDHPTARELSAAVERRGEDDGDRPPTADWELISAEDRARMPADVVDAYPLAALQAGMVYHMESDPANLPYHNVDSFRVRGPWAPEELARAVADCVARHAILRTSFDFDGFSQPLQLVHAEADLPVRFEDLRALPATEQRAHVAALIEAERARPFDLSRPPFFRFFFTRLADDEFQWTLTEHHAIQDGWSLHSMFAEILDRYVLLIDEPAAPRAAEPTVRFRDFVREEIAARDSRAARDYWERLRGREPATLPAWPAAWHGGDAAGTGAFTEWTYEATPEAGRFGYLETKLPHELGARLVAAAARMRVPMKSVLLAAHMRVLGLLYGTREPLSGLTFNGRPDVPGATETRGLFLNTLPLRAELVDGTWEQLCRSMLAHETELLPHRRYSYFDVLRQVGTAGEFDVSFVYNHFHVLAPTLRSGRVGIVDDKIDSFMTGRSEPTNFSLVAGFLHSPLDSAILFALDYDVRKLGARQVAGIRDLYVRALTAIADDPAARWEETVLGEPDAGLLTAPAVVDPPGTVVDMFEAVVVERSDAPAVEWGRKRWSYADVHAVAARFARLLHERGARTGTPVALVLDRTPDLVVAVLGTLLAGAVLVPLDPDLPPARVARMLSRLGGGYLVTDRPIEVPGWTQVRVADTTAARPPAGPVVAPGDLAYVIHTSGSTGDPRAVAVPHAAAATYLRSAADTFGLGRGRVPLFGTIGADLTITSLLGPLVAGGTVVLTGETESRLAVQRGLAEPGRYAVVKVTPTHLRMLAAARYADVRAEVDLLVVGGEALTGADLAAWWAHRPGTRIVNEYGPTETTVGCTVHEAVAGVEGPVSIGVPVAGTTIALLDDSGRPVPAGVPGEIHIGGPLVSWGYLGDPAATAAMFVPDPDGPPGARRYRSGDLGRRMPDGTLDYLGRDNAQTKINGYRVEPAEIEAVLTEHPEVSAAVVVAAESRLVAYLVCAELPADWRAHAAALLPGHMVPSVAVAIDEVPLTASGKVDRRRLPAPPDAAAAQPSREPSTPLEKAIATIWHETLEVGVIGVDDDFFRLGGHSLAATRMAFQIADQFGITLRLADVLRGPSIGAIAELVLGRISAAAAQPRDVPAVTP